MRAIYSFNKSVLRIIYHEETCGYSFHSIEISVVRKDGFLAFNFNSTVGKDVNFFTVDNNLQGAIMLAPSVKVRVIFGIYFMPSTRY